MLASECESARGDADFVARIRLGIYGESGDMNLFRARPAQSISSDRKGTDEKRLGCDLPVLASH